MNFIQLQENRKEYGKENYINLMVSENAKEEIRHSTAGKTLFSVVEVKLLI